MNGIYSLDDIRKFVSSREPQGVLLDTGVLLPYLVGFYRPDAIEKADFSRSSNIKFSELDFELINEIRHLFKRAFVTPQILTEFSNLAKLSKSSLGKDFPLFYSAAIEALRGKDEKPFSKNEVINLDINLLSQFGITDTSLIEIAKKEGLVILTIDDDLTRLCETKGVPVILYNRIQADMKINP